MTREIVTSENREDYMKKKLGIEDEKQKNSINLDKRDIEINQHPSDEKSKNELHFVNTDKFDEGFKRNSGQYIGEGGKGNSISDRYEKIGEFLKKAPSMEASDAHVRENGLVDFGNGRHRYAYLRDRGLKKIPMSMSKEAVKNAKKHGYLD
jgi:hypothetical protein